MQTAFLRLTRPASIRQKLRLLAAVLAAGTILGTTVVGLPATAEATPGGNNYAFFVGNGGDPTNGTIYFYDNGTQAAANQSGSGTSVAANNSPCNKYWGGSDTNGGGRIPYTSWGAYDSDLWPYGWSAVHAPYNPGLRLSNGTATGSTFDCAATGSITRDGLWIHNWNNNYVTQGCIKMNNTDLFWFDIRYHQIWGGSDGVSVWDVVVAW